jgi:TRAP-type C4-dicarboxylate transport system permease small subunit
MRYFSLFMSRVSKVCAIVASVLLALAAVVIVWMVTTRTMGNSTSWELELSIFLMVASLFFASPYTLLTKGHVGVDLLGHYMSERSAKQLELIANILGLCVCIFLTWICFEFTVDSFLKGERTESMWGPPKWPLYATMPIGFGLTVLQYIAIIADRQAQFAGEVSHV